ncbi:MAG: cation:proton antiporter [Deltaproteobacteria bacterium]|nr:cation:proton antiporter [Deltaproteobacteria bacterium]
MGASAGVDLGLLLGQMFVIIGSCRVLGLVARRLRQPLVIAEIAAGIALGPTVLGRLWPEAMATLFPVHSVGALDAISQIGLVLFMFVVGLELDPELLRGRSGLALRASLGGIGLPLVAGSALAAALWPALAPDGVDRLPFMLFIGATMSITAFPVLARIAGERGLLRTPLGGVTMACAAFADVAAWSLIAAAIGVAGSGGLAEAGLKTAGSAAFMLFMVFVARPFLAHVARRFLREERITSAGFAIVVMMLLGTAVAGEQIGVHALLSAFVLGAVMPREGGIVHVLTARIEELVVVLFLPIFFAVTGLRADLGDALDGRMIGVTLAVFLTASLSKVVGTLLPALRGGLGLREATTLAVLMNTRGLMELVILNIGRDMGVLTDKLFGAMVIGSLTNTFMTSPLVSLLRPSSAAPPPLPSAGPSATGAGDVRLLVSVARPQNLPRLAQVGALLAKDGEALALSLTAVREQGQMVPPAEEELAVRALSGKLADALAVEGVAARSMSFSSDEPGRDIALIARTQRSTVVLVGVHQPLLGQAVFGGPIKTLANELDADLCMLMPRDSFDKAILVTEGPHGAAAARVGARLRAAGLPVEELPVTLSFEELAARAHNSALLIIGVGGAWTPAIAGFELRHSPVCDELRCSVLFVHDPEPGAPPTTA